MLKRTLMAQFGASMDLLKTDVGAMQQLQKSLEGKFDTNNSSLVILMQRLTENMEGHIKQQRLDTATQLEEAFNKATQSALEATAKAAADRLAVDKSVTEERLLLTKQQALAAALVANRKALAEEQAAAEEHRRGWVSMLDYPPINTVTTYLV